MLTDGTQLQYCSRAGIGRSQLKQLFTANRGWCQNAEGFRSLHGDEKVAVAYLRFALCHAKAVWLPT
ncbi:hypothetical protein MPTK1_3g01010 [Marchantia polymorpha subsp. ruderalis]|uniref:Uncharacterized protein n=2 Tax=Marchantia polymorpha TaxID=3197 RepID=A0AAF6AW36_MARPO|nr:hypothetical protein MARPO_0007s0097 [Marchantia polymorpha]BBN03970.1 hypothetical protein Mp_3g01010 [Marchantia polymorpha subsp. ruderalis]|eukprot:PTQ47659.1 hypothetical protein MARPO_0007s0097 [Marchantia polymorpha]